MNLRFIERDGKKILQHQGSDSYSEFWYDVPLVAEKKEPREYLIEVFDNRLGPYRAWPSKEVMLKYIGDKPNPQCMIKVREVLE